MNIASSVVKIMGTDGVNTFVRPKLSTDPISPVQGVKIVDGFKGKMPSANFEPQVENFENNNIDTLGRYVDIYA